MATTQLNVGTLFPETRPPRPFFPELRPPAIVDVRRPIQGLARPGPACPIRPIPLLSQAENAVTITKKERDEILTDAAKREAALENLIIVKSAISLYSWEDMQKVAGPIRVTNLNLHGNGSVNDPRMGVVNPNVACQYCSQIDCPGHYGLIEFRSPIHNPIVIRQTVSVLICVCNDCGGLLIPADVMRQQGFTRLSQENRLAAMEKYCKQDLVCLRQKPQIAGGDIVPCAKNPSFITQDIKEKGEITYKILQQGTKKSSDDPTHIMPIETAINILDRISAADARLLGFAPGDHPRNMIMRGILVPPVIARPPVYEGGSIHHDQLTHMFLLIQRKVMDLAHGKSGASSELYTAVKQLIFKTEGKRMGMREFLSIIERIQGKHALLRELLMGKRVNWCGRTVAGPDSSLKFGQIRIPQAWASVLTKKIRVTDFNIRALTNLLEAGRITHLTPKKTGLRRSYTKGSKFRLQIGDTVDRWLQDGDRIVINRQPTLHRQSMMAYEVVLAPFLTIGLHLSYTSPMNCDFDGDENNAWNPQDFEVEAEVDTLMNVTRNVMSSEQNKPIMGWVMNSISGAYLLSNALTRINDDLFAELLTLITNHEAFRTLRQRLIKYGVNPRSGQAIFSAMLPENFYYEQKGILIMEGILVHGRLKKSHLGTSHRSTIQDLWKNYGPARTSDFFTDGPWVINKWLVERGFSVGLSDMINLAIDEKTGEEYDKNKRLLGQELALVHVQLEALGGKMEDPIEESFRQRQINNILNITNGIGMRLAKDAFSGDNSIGVMTEHENGSGSKGGLANIGQMMGSVGQQFYRSERLKPTLTNGTRLLPTYDPGDDSPEARAFIPQSFFTGLTPEGLFHLQQGGREGLMDTALKTAETGSMSHRMIKAFENILIGYDGSIRNTIGTMFAPMYNSGYDIAELLAVSYKSKPDFSSFIDLKSTIAELNIERGWVQRKTNDLIVAQREKLNQEGLPPDNILPHSPNYGNGPRVKSEPVALDVTQPVPVTGPITRITKFERARIIGTRATQLSHNAPPLVDIGTEMDPVKIANMEYEAGVLPLYIIRRFGDGSHQIIRPTLDNI